GRGGRQRVHHGRRGRQGRPGREGGGRRKVGRGRAEEDLRRLMASQGDRMKRRTFLKTAGVAGIVAAGRAPAFAQGTKLHIVRWVDFIPEADVELTRHAPEASKALAPEVTFEFINA